MRVTFSVDTATGSTLQAFGDARSAGLGRVTDFSLVPREQAATTGDPSSDPKKLRSLKCNNCSGEGHFYLTCPEIGKALSVPFTSPRIDASSMGQGGGVAVSTMESWADTKISRDVAVDRIQIWNVEVAGKTASQISMIESVVTAAEVAAQKTNGRKKKRKTSKAKKSGESQEEKDVFEEWLVEGQIKTTKVSGSMTAMLACATGVFSSTLKVGARCGFCIKLRGRKDG